MLRTAALLGAGAALAPLIARCSSAGPSPSAGSPSPSAAGIGGPLNYIGFEGEDKNDAAQPFLDKYGITLNSTYTGDNPEIVTKIKAGGPGRYDVTAQFDRYIPLMIDQGMVGPLNMSLIPNFEKLYEPFRKAPWVERDGQFYAVPAIFGFHGYNYRTDKVNPDDYKIAYEALIDPRFKGLVGVRSDATDNLLLIGALVFGYGVDGLKYTKDMLNDTLAMGAQAQGQCEDEACRLR